MSSCGCAKKKPSVTPVTNDPLVTYRVVVEEEIAFMSRVLRSPVILEKNTINTVYREDMPTLNATQVAYQMV